MEVSLATAIWKIRVSGESWGNEEDDDGRETIRNVPGFGLGCAECAAWAPTMTGYYIFNEFAR